MHQNEISKESQNLTAQFFGFDARGEPG